MPADLEELSLDDLRRRRDVVREQGEELSYRRRLLHAQIDLVGAVAAARGDQDLESVLARALTDEPGGGSGEVRAVSVEGEHGDLEPLPEDLTDLDDTERDALLERLRDREEAVSERRRQLLAELDELQAELVRRYRRDGVDARRLLRGSD